MPRSTRLAPFILMLVLATGTFADPGQPVAVRLWPGGAVSVEVTTLPNGLRVASDRMDTVETATIGIYVGSGTRHEPAAEGYKVFKGADRHVGYRDALRVDAQAAAAKQGTDQPPKEQQGEYRGGAVADLPAERRLALDTAIHALSGDRDATVRTRLLEARDLVHCCSHCDCDGSYPVNSNRRAKLVSR